MQEELAQQVDVIIPTLNSMPLLKEAVESVLSQTHKRLLLYVVDDGSDDHGATAKYVKGVKDPRVTYVKRPKLGRSAARNYGIKLSESPYVAFLDADDLWYPEKLDEQLRLIASRPSVGMVYGLCKVLDEQGEVSGHWADVRRGELFKYLLGGNKISGSASIVLLRREVFDKVGVFREDFSMGEDWEMWLRVALHYPIDYVPKFLAAYRVGAISSRPKFIAKARGLDYALPVMIDEFKLGPINRARLATACLGQACGLYLDGGDRQLARRTFVRMLGYNPVAWITPNRYRLFTYLRIVLGNQWLRAIRRQFSKKYRLREKSKDE